MKRVFLSTIILLLCEAFSHAQVLAPPATVATLAGTAGSKGNADGTGAAASFNFPHSLAVDAAGIVYVADMDSHTIRKITPDGVVMTLAGQAASKGSLDARGTASRFRSPAGIAIDAAGVLYVADAGNHTIRKISAGGEVSTLAGTAGQKGSTDGLGAAAQFNFPHGVAVARDGTVYVADTYGHTIRKITPAGAVTTLAGQPGQKGSTDGAGSAARFFHPSGLAVDDQGTIYVADNGNHSIRKITSAGVVSTLAGLPGHKGSADGPGVAARFDVPGSVAVDASGGVYVADYINSIIRMVTPQGVVTTFAGVLKGWSSQDGSRAEARFKFPFGVAVGLNGWVYVADSGNRTIRIIR